MKSLINKLFSYSFSFFILLSCSSIPKEYLTNDDICHYNDPIFKITKDEMTFEILKYKNDLETKPKPIVIENNNKYKNELWSSNNGGIRNKQTNKELNIQKLIRYDSIGRISYSHLTYLNGYARISKRINYDQQGNITKIIDYEKGYKICWAEAIEIVKKIAKKDIKKYEVTSFNLLRNDLNEFPNLKPKWNVTLNGNKEYESKSYSNDGEKIYVIDGITGKLIKIKKYRMVYDGMVE